jgi:alkylation response protein AidB-like acyl-CoA dehydrogenase
VTGGTEARSPEAARTARLDQAIAAIAAGAEALDREPRFPREAFDELAAAGALGATIGAARGEGSVAPEWALLRRVAAADASAARVLDGHLNAVERLEVAAEPWPRERELAAVAAGERLLGVWGADPGPGEGEPARLYKEGGRLVLRGAKTFCSGAGGVDAALVMVGSDDGTAPALAFVECDERAEVDHGWYRAAGLRASESHRVIFHDAPAVVLGEPGELALDPWFSRDAMRTAASWAGMVDAAADAALEELAERRASDPLAHLAAGRILAARGTVDAWLERAGRVADAALVDFAMPGQGQLDSGEPRATGIAMRAEIDRAAKLILAEAAVACGSHPFVTAGRLDRARRDLETFLLQHRLDPLLARLGGARLERR